MTVEQIFSDLSAHMIKGIMVHDQLSNYYNFLDLQGFKRCHEYHFHRESNSYKKLCEYYIDRYHKLVAEKRVDNPNIIPESWYKYSRPDVDMNTKKNAVKSGFERWVSWERETKKLYQEYYIELLDTGEVDAAQFVGCLVSEVSDELKTAERKWIYYASVDYDLVMVLSEQKAIHDKYKRKTK